MSIRLFAMFVVQYLCIFLVPLAFSSNSTLERPIILAKSSASAHGRVPHESAWIRKVLRTRMLGADVKMDIRRRGNRLKGVAYVRLPFDKWRTYHFTGKIQGGHVRATHHSGHHFEGQITRDNMVQGILTTSKGRRIPLKMRMP
jgi:hypothetical protein